MAGALLVPTVTFVFSSLNFFHRQITEGEEATHQHHCVSVLFIQFSHARLDPWVLTLQTLMNTHVTKRNVFMHFSVTSAANLYFNWKCWNPSKVGQQRVYFMFKEGGSSTNKAKTNVIARQFGYFILFQKYFFFLLFFPVYRFEQQGNLWREPSPPTLHPHTLHNIPLFDRNNNNLNHNIHQF